MEGSARATYGARVVTVLLRQCLCLCGKEQAFLNLLSVTAVGYFHRGFLREPHLDF